MEILVYFGSGYAVRIYSLYFQTTGEIKRSIRYQI